MPDPIPAIIEGTIFMGVRMTSPRVGGPEFAPLLRRQHHMLAGAVMVHEGRFELPQLAAVGHAIRADALLRAGQGEEAIAEARRGISLAAADPRAWISLGDALLAAGRVEEATQALAGARRLVAAQPKVYAFAVPRLEGLAERLATSGG
jgi:tetratricopeptide (TPR) repeat protein